jgi:MFS family permease
VVYLKSVTVTVVLAGRFGDLLGHGRVLIAGLGIFALASVACATAPTLGTLIAARAAQGAGGAILMALPVSMVRNTVDPGRIGAAMGFSARHRRSEPRWVHLWAAS